MSLRCDPGARHIYPCLVLVQPRKTLSCLTERLLMGGKESNKTNKLWHPLINMKILSIKHDYTTKAVFDLQMSLYKDISGFRDSSLASKAQLR